MRVPGYFLKCVHRAVVSRRGNTARLLMLFILLALIIITAAAELKNWSVL